MTNETANPVLRELQHKIIRASAGTGKTHNLSNQYITVLLAGAPVHKVLASTFTRKAAGEILERVMLRVAEAAASEEGTRELVGQLNINASVTQAEMRGMLRRLCHSLDSVAISTLDSFFSRVAGSFRYELGIPAEPLMAAEDDPTVAELRSEAVTEILYGGDRETLREMVRDLHKGAAKRSVKETIDDIVKKVYEVYREADDSAWEYPAVGGARLNSADIARRVAALESLSVRYKTEGVKSLPGGIDTTVKKVAAEDWPKVLSSGLGKPILTGTNKCRSTEITPEVMAEARPLIDHAKNVITDRIRSQTIATHRLMKDFDERFTRLRRERNVMLFSDLPYKLSQELTAEPEILADIYYRLDGRLDHLLLDEFQDTSLLQWNVFRPVAQEIRSHGDAADSGRSFFCVGDVKQAIYGWRGGCSQIFNSLPDELNIEEKPEDALTENRRSSPVILETVDGIFTALKGNPALEGYDKVIDAWTCGYQKHIAHYAKRPGYVEIVTRPAESGDSDPESGGETNAAVEKIAELYRRHPEYEIGVLVRTKKSGAEILDGLRALSIPASGEGGNVITDDPAVTRILAAITLADHPGDKPAAYELEHSELFEPLCREAGSNEFTAISVYIRRRIIDDGIAEVVRRLGGFMAGKMNRRSSALVEKLLGMADGFDRMKSLRTTEFIERVKITRVQDPSSARVRVMTVHASKGLQFDVVVLPELNSSLASTDQSLTASIRKSTADPIEKVMRRPSFEETYASDEIMEAYRQEKERSLEDDLSVLYVAMTRARYALHMIVDPLKWEKEKVGKKYTTSGWTNPSYATLLRRGLAEPQKLETEDTYSENMNGGDRIFHQGEDDWYDQLPESEKKKTDTSDVAAVAEGLDIKLNLNPKTPRRSLVRVSPSCLAGKEKRTASEALNTGRKAAASRGTVLHYWFEQIEWLEDGDDAEAIPGKEALFRKTRKKYPAVTDESLAEYHRTFISALSTDIVRQAFTKPPADQGAAWEVWRERRFATANRNRLVSGTFDRVAVLRGPNGRPLQAICHDWKTTSSGEGKADEELQKDLNTKYEAQLNEYGEVLRKMLGVEDVEVAVVPVRM